MLPLRASQLVYCNLRLDSGFRVDLQTQAGSPPHREAAFLVTGPRRVGVTERTSVGFRLGVTRVLSALQCHTLPITYVEQLPWKYFLGSRREYSAKVQRHSALFGVRRETVQATHKNLHVPTTNCQYRNNARIIVRHLGNTGTNSVRYQLPVCFTLSGGGAINFFINTGFLGILNIILSGSATEESFGSTDIYERTNRAVICRNRSYRRPYQNFLL